MGIISLSLRPVSIRFVCRGNKLYRDLLITLEMRDFTFPDLGNLFRSDLQSKLA